MITIYRFIRTKLRAFSHHIAGGGGGGSPPPSSNLPFMEIGRIYTYPCVTSTPGAITNPPRFFQGLTDNIPGSYWAEINRRIDNDAVSPYNNVFQAKLVDYDLNLNSPPGSGYVMLNALVWPDTVTGIDNAIFADSSYAKPFNIVRGDTTMRQMTYFSTDGTTAADSDPGPVPYDATIALQGWPFARGDRHGSSATLVSGSPVVAGIVTTYLESGHRYSVDFLSPTRLYTIQTIDSPTQITLTEPYQGVTGNGQVQGPYDRPTGPAESGIGDTHCICWIRDETTGRPAYLYEDYKVFSPDGSGLTWEADGGVKWNLLTGAQRPECLSSVNAAGLPLGALIPTYEECASGEIRHPIRMIVSSALGLSFAGVWPATHGAGCAFTSKYYPWSSGFLPCGARLRLKQSWLNSNLSSYPAIYQPILTALNRYGGIVTDFTGGYTLVQIEVFSDHRWNFASPSLSTVPMTAFELVDTIRSPVTISCPSTPMSGVQYNISISYDNNASTNIASSTVDLGVSDPNGGSVTLLSSVLSDTTHRSWSANWTPATTGTHIFTLFMWGRTWILPSNVNRLSDAGVTWPVNVVMPLPSASYTWIKSGDGIWSDTTAWSPTPHAGGPGAVAGDLATINAHTVTIDSAAGANQDGHVTLGSDSISPGIALTINDAGTTVAISGNKLTLRGNLAIYGGVTPAFITATPGGKLIFDPVSTGTQLSIIPASYVTGGIRFAGDRNNRCLLSTDYTRIGVTGLGTYIVSAHHGTNGIHLLQHTDIYNFGDTTNPGINTIADAPGNGGSADILVSGCRFYNSSCSFSQWGGGAWDNNFAFVETRFFNSKPYLSATLPVCLSIAVAQSTSGTRLVHKVAVDHGCYIYTPMMTVTKNIFANPIGDAACFTNGGVVYWTDNSLFSKNVFVQFSTGGDIFTIYGPSKDNYFVHLNGTNPHFTSVSQTSQSQPGYITESWILEAPNFDNYGFDGNDGGDAFMAAGSTAWSYYNIWQNCLGLSNVYGGGPGALVTWFRTSPPFSGVGHAWHNTWCNASQNTIDAGEGAGTLGSGAWQSYKGNIDFSYLSAPHRFAHWSDVNDTGIVDILIPSGADYNAGFNLSTTWTSGYHGTFSSFPGYHDVFEKDPAFIDPTRSFRVWGITQGADGTDLGALEKISNDPTLIDDLFDFVREGYTPRNTSYNVTFPGDTLATDARGQNWSGSQWIGAISGLKTSFVSDRYIIPANQTTTLTLSGSGTTWTTGSNIIIQNSITGTTTAVTGVWNRTSNTSATLNITTTAGTGTFRINIDNLLGPRFTMAPASIVSCPVKLQPSISSPVTLILTGVATAWTSGSTVTVNNSVTGTTTVTKDTWLCISPGFANLSVHTGAGEGTFTVTIDGITSVPITVGAMSFSITPNPMPQNTPADYNSIITHLVGSGTKWTGLQAQTSRRLAENNFGTGKFFQGFIRILDDTHIDMANWNTTAGTGLFTITIDGVTSSPCPIS